MTDGYDSQPAAKETHADKLKKALEFLGERWVLHPKYRTDPRHWLNPQITYKPTPRTLKEAYAS